MLAGLCLTVAPGLAFAEPFLTLEARAFETRLNDPAVRWVHWWESRVDGLHERLRAQQHPADFPETLEREFIEALREAASRGQPEVLEQALLGLAQMQDPELIDRILGPAPPSPTAAGPPGPPPLIEHANPRVRRAAWLSLGLLDHPRAEQALKDPRTGLSGSTLDELSRVVGLGLSKSLDAQMAERLKKAVLSRKNDDEIRRMALWALRTHEQAPDALVQGVIRDSRHPALVQEALLSISAADRVTWLVQIAGLTGSGRSIAAYRALDRYGQDFRIDTGLPYANNPYDSVPRSLIYGSTARTIEIELQTAALVSLEALQLEREQGRYADVRRRLALSADVIGLQAGDKTPPRSEEGKIVSNRHMLRGQAILSIARSSPGEDADLQLLRDLLAGDTRTITGFHGRKPQIRVAPDPDNPDDQPEPHGIIRPHEDAEILIVRTPMAPARGFAAVGIGLVIARYDARSPWAIGLRPEEILPHRAERFRRRALRDMAKTLRDPREPALLRSGVALGLGLGNDPDALHTLRDQINRLQRGDELLAGYLALGLCLHGHPDGTKLGLKILDRTAPAGSPLAQAQRAAAQGLMLMGEPSAITAALDRTAARQDPWVREPLLRAALTHLSNRDELIEGLLAELPHAEPAHAATLIRALVDTIAPASQRRLNRLTDRVNFAMTFDERSNLLPRVVKPIHPLWTERYWPTRDFYMMVQPYLYDKLLTR